MLPYQHMTIWNAQDCADYLKQSRQEFLRITRHTDKFPPELQNRPRHWNALLVMQWANAGQILPERPHELAKSLIPA